MSITVEIDENQSVTVTEEVVETEASNRIAFAVEGTITTTSELLDEFEGSALRPVRIGVAVDDSDTVAVDLTGDAFLRLDSVDVGVETPDAGDLSPGMGAAGSSGDDDSKTPSVGAVAFTVEGEIGDVPAETIDRLTDESPAVTSITFDVGDPVRSDGGGEDVLFELGLFGYGVTILHDGTIEVKHRSQTTDVFGGR